jgi:hypothetical protein
LKMRKNSWVMADMADEVCEMPMRRLNGRLIDIRIYLPMIISTRRFLARPSGVSLDTNGLLAP